MANSTKKQPRTQNNSKKRSTRQPERDIFADLEKGLGRIPILDEENEDEFNLLLDNLISSVRPTDAIEFIYVRDFAIVTSEINRLRRHQQLLLKMDEAAAIRSLIPYDITKPNNADTIARGWTSNDPAIVTAMTKHFEKFGLTAEAVSAKTFSSNLDDMDKISRMVCVAEARRIAILREIDRRRYAFKKRLEETIRNEDGSYSLADAKNHHCENSSGLKPADD